LSSYVINKLLKPKYIERIRYWYEKKLEQYKTQIFIFTKPEKGV
jgi:hypothetical protein